MSRKKEALFKKLTKLAYDDSGLVEDGLRNAPRSSEVLKLEELVAYIVKHRDEWRERRRKQVQELKRLQN